MLNRFILLALFNVIVILSYAQEKRIALVIGNANYSSEAVLQNPINDAILMENTLKNLGFDVMVETDIETRGEFVEVIEKYNESRKRYNVGIVYYAGHAVQINGVNYMLATKEKYESESNIKYNGLDISIFTSEWDNVYNNELNILVLDACRNNPFEKKIYGEARDIKSSGYGLAEINRSSQPTGSLVAFSTAAGKTAADAFDGSKNSLYCMSLCKNLQLEDVSIRNIFGKVSREIYMQTGQYPELSDKMFDVDFYLKKSTFQDEIQIIDSLIDAEDYFLANEKTLLILGKSVNNKDALLRKGRIEYRSDDAYNGYHLFKADSLYPNDVKVLEYIGRYYSTMNNLEKAIWYINKAITLDSEDPILYYWKARIYEDGGELQEAEKQYEKYLSINLSIQSFLEFADFYGRNNKIEKAIEIVSRAIEIDKKDIELLTKRALLYSSIGDKERAENDFNRAVNLSPENAQVYIDRADFYLEESEQQSNLKKALNDYKSAFEFAETLEQKIHILNNRSLIYTEQGEFDLAIKELSSIISFNTNEPIVYRNRAKNYAQKGDLDEAVKDYTHAIEIDPNNAENYYARYLFYLEYTRENLSALSDINDAIKLEPSNIDYLYSRSNLWQDEFNDSEKAIEDLLNALKIDPLYTDAINALGIIYTSTGDTTKAFQLFNEGISHANTNPEASAFCYRNRADLFTAQGELNNAEADLSRAIELTPTNSDSYYVRAYFYLENVGNYKACIKDLDIAIQLNPNNINYLFLRGQVNNDYLFKKENAIKDFEKILLIDSTNIDALNEIGLIFQNDNKLDLAMQWYNKCIQYEKTQPESVAYCYANRASIYEQKEELIEALNNYNYAIALSPSNGEFYSYRGNFNKDVLNKPYDALVDYSLAISVDSGNVYNWFMRGLLFSNNLNDHVSAINDYKEILKIDSNDVAVLNWLGVFYGRVGNDSLELEYYRRAINIDSNLVKDKNEYYETLGWAYNNLAYYYQKINDNTCSLNFYNSAIKYDPKEVLRYYERAWFFALYTNDFKSAIHDINEAIKINKEDPYFFLQRAKINKLSENFKDAKNDYKKAIELSNEGIIYLLEMAEFYNHINDTLNADKIFQIVDQQDSMNKNYLHFKTTFLIKNKKYEEAIRYAKISIELDSKDTISYFQLGQIYQYKKDNLKALNAYKNAEDIMVYSDHYKAVDASDESQIFLSDVQNRIKELYIILGEIDLSCEYQNKAIESLSQETRSKKNNLLINIMKEDIYE
jgi:tetratricopeptide (TPR) repeat protein